MNFSKKKNKIKNSIKKNKYINNITSKRGGSGSWISSFKSTSNTAETPAPEGEKKSSKGLGFFNSVTNGIGQMVEGTAKLAGNVGNSASKGLISATVGKESSAGQQLLHQQKAKENQETDKEVADMGLPSPMRRGLVMTRLTTGLPRLIGHNKRTKYTFKKNLWNNLKRNLVLLASTDTEILLNTLGLRDKIDINGIKNGYTNYIKEDDTKLDTLKKFSSEDYTNLIAKVSDSIDGRNTDNEIIPLGHILDGVKGVGEDGKDIVSKDIKNK